MTKLSHNSMVAHLSSYPPAVQTRRTEVQSSLSKINDSGDVHSSSMVAHLSNTLSYPPAVQTRRTEVQFSHDAGDVNCTSPPSLTSSVPTMPFLSSVAHAVNFVPQATIKDLR